MAKNDNLTDFLKDVADAIREKKGTTDLINPQDFSAEIASIQSGGGGGNAIISTIIIDQSIAEPSLMVSGDVNGMAIQIIRERSHRFLGKYTADNTMTICQLSDSNSALYDDGATALLTGEEGDVFMKMPQFFYKAEEIETDKWAISFLIGETPSETSWKTWDTNTLIGVYLGKGDTDGSSMSKLYSISGKTPTRALQRGVYYRAARGRGNGYRIVDWQMHCVMALLFFARYGHTDSHSIVGAGCYYLTATGGSNVCGMRDTKGSQPIVGLNDKGKNANGAQVNFWGLESWWGQTFEWIDNVRVDAGIWSVNENGEARKIGSATNASGYIAKLKFGEHLDLVPTTIATSSGKGYCDYSMISAKLLGVMVCRSWFYNSSSAYAGVVALKSTTSENELASNDYWGARLAFRGNCIEERDSATYKALLTI